MKSTLLGGLIAVATLLSFAAAGVRAEEGQATPASRHGAPQVSSPFDGAKALDISQGAIGGTVSAHAFTDASGQPLDLGQLRGKPLIVSMIFTSCYHTCPLITENLRRAVATAQVNLGKDAFSVVTVGFDTKVDTPERMRVFGKNHGVNLPNWHLLSGDEATIRKLSDELGFIFFPTPRGFDHLAQTTILDRDGKVYRQVYGAAFTTPSLVEPLKDLVFGRVRDFTTITGIANRIRLFCTLYDPRDDRYYFDYSVFIGMIIGALILTAMGTILVRNIWRLWRTQRAS